MNIAGHPHLVKKIQTGTENDSGQNIGIEGAIHMWKLRMKRWHESRKNATSRGPGIGRGFGGRVRVERAHMTTARRVHEQKCHHETL